MENNNETMNTLNECLDEIKSLCFDVDDLIRDVYRKGNKQSLNELVSSIRFIKEYADEMLNEFEE